MVVIVFPTVVLPEENLDAPHGLDGICVVPGVWIDEVYAVVHSVVHATQRIEIPVPTPASLMTIVPGSIQACTMVISVGGSVRYGNKKCLPDPRSTPPNTHTITGNVLHSGCNIKNAEKKGKQNTCVSLVEMKT
jgi:hypothetical protein